MRVKDRILYPFFKFIKKGCVTVRDFNGVIKSTLADQMMFSDIYGASHKLQSATKELAQNGLPKSEAMIFDLWSGLYKVSPQFQDAEQIPSELKLNEKIIRMLHSMPEHGNLKKHCTLDEIMAAVGTLQLASEVKNILERRMANDVNFRKAIEKLQKADTLLTLAEAIQQAGESWRQPQFIETLASLVGHNAAETIAELPDADKASATLEKMADNLTREYETALDETLEDSDFKKQLKEAVENTLKNIETLDEALSQFRGWGNSTGSNTQLDAKTIAESAEYLMELPQNRWKILQIMKLAGRMSHAALSKRKAKVEIPYPEQWDGYEEGNEIERLIPQDLLALRHPVMKRDFLKRFADKKLLQYRIDPVQYAGNGPIIVCVDESGSMAGRREIWAKAVALALFNIAMKKHRPYALIRFSASTRKPFFAHPKKKIKLDQMLSELEKRTGGGTNFEKPLQKAVEIIKSNKTYKKADIVFITDGECPVAPEFLEEFLKLKAKRKVSVLSILIGHYTSSIEKFSDVVYRTSAKTEEGVEVLELFLEQTRKAR